MLCCYILLVRQVGIFLNVLSLIKLCRGFGAVKRVGLKIPWLHAFEGSIPSSGIYILILLTNLDSTFSNTSIR